MSKRIGDLLEGAHVLVVAIEMDQLPRADSRIPFGATVDFKNLFNEQVQVTYRKKMGMFGGFGRFLWEDLGGMEGLARSGPRKGVVQVFRRCGGRKWTRG